MRGARALEIGEFDQIISDCYGSLSTIVAERTSTAYMVMMFAGLRVAECCALRAGDVPPPARLRDPSSSAELSARRRRTKGKRCGRTVPMNDVLRLSLARWLELSGINVNDGEALIFPACTRGHSGRLLYGQPLKPTTLAHVFWRAARRLRLGPNVSTHSFRKSCAERWYEESGHDILVVMELLGHSNVATTQRYLQANRGRVLAAALAPLRGATLNLGGML